MHVRLVPATTELIDTELEDPVGLADALDVLVPEDWPPEHHDAGSLAFMRRGLEEPGADGWWLHYVVADDTLVGSMGYKGPPEDGVVEIGYSVVRSWQRRGVATAGCQELIETAWQRGARTVRAQTLPELEASIGVLEKLGFTAADPLEPGVLNFELRR